MSPFYCLMLLIKLRFYLLGVISDISMTSPFRVLSNPKYIIDIHVYCQ